MLARQIRCPGSPLGGHCPTRLKFVADDAAPSFRSPERRSTGLANIRGQFENYPGMDEAALKIWS